MAHIPSDIANTILGFEGRTYPSYARVSSSFQQASIPRTKEFQRKYPFWDLVSAKEILRNRYGEFIQFYLNRAAYEGDWPLFLAFLKYYTSLPPSIDPKGYMKEGIIISGIMIAHEFNRDDIANRIIDQYGYPYYLSTELEWFRFKRGEISLKKFIDELYTPDYQPIDWIGYIPIEVTNYVLSSPEFQKRIKNCINPQEENEWSEEMYLELGKRTKEVIQEGYAPENHILRILRFIEKGIEEEFQKKKEESSNEYHFDCDLLYIIVGPNIMANYIPEDKKIAAFSQFFGKGDPRTIQQLAASIPITELTVPQVIEPYRADFSEQQIIYRNMLSQSIRPGGNNIIVTPQMVNAMELSDRTPYSIYSSNPMYALYVSSINAEPLTNEDIQRIYDPIEKIVSIIKDGLDPMLVYS